ncbi:MAG: sensor histidine kinase, partial [Vulcanimicrobiota bacterium]
NRPKIDLLGRYLLGTLVVENLEKNLLALEKMEGENTRFEISVIEPIKREFLVSVSRLKKREGYVLVFHDVTEDRRAKKMKNEFFTLLSHELRTPLTGIIGFTDILAEELNGRIDSDQEEYFNLLKHNSRYMLEIIDELLSLAHLTGNGLGVEKRRVRLLSVIHQVILELEGEREQKNINIEFVNSSDIELWAAREWLRELFHQIIQNAFNFNKANGSVIIEMIPGENDITVNISDTGTGIPGSDLDKVFDTFYQVEQVLTRQNDGLGLGLSLARHIVELHQGRISLDSEYGRGTCVSIQLPLAPVASPEEKQTG